MKFISWIFIFSVALTGFGNGFAQINTVTVPSSKISSSDIEKWTKIVEALNEKQTLPEGLGLLLVTYLHNAQKKFAEESFAKTGAYSGTLDPISLHVVQLFYPNYQNQAIKQDPFSNELTAIVAKDVDRRFNAEKKCMKELILRSQDNVWKGKQPYYGLLIPSFQPWILNRQDEFLPPPLPSYSDQEFWNDQINAVKIAMRSATPEQKQRILYWANKGSRGSGDWKVIAATYMEKQHVPMDKQLQVRAHLATTINDTMIAVILAKYRYLVKRPKMIDPSLKTVIDAPNHPSYPSGHSTSGAAAEAILTYYFPENEKEWKRLAEECGLSRIWAGIHFPVDHTTGVELGRKIAQASLERFNNTDFWQQTHCIGNAER